MRRRKTIEVEAVREAVNYVLLNNKFSADYRLGVANVLEHILMDTGNYRGYNYLTEDEMEWKDEKPGIRFAGTYDEKFADTDDSRRYYF